MGDRTDYLTGSMSYRKIYKTGERIGERSYRSGYRDTQQVREAINGGK